MASSPRYATAMAYTNDEILEFYRIIARKILEMDRVYGIRHITPGAKELLGKLEKLVEEVDTTPGDSA